MAAKEAVKYLVSSPQPSWVHTTATSIIWNRRNPTFQKPKFPEPEARNWKLHAEAKGFNRTPPNRRERNVAGKSPERNDDDEKIPEVVWNRMMARILAHVGVPLAAGIVLLQIFGVVMEERWLDVPIWVPYFTTFVTFGASALGIAYGTLSTSWDPERKGSFLGLEQVQKNWVEMWSEDDETGQS